MTLRRHRSPSARVNEAVDVLVTEAAADVYEGLYYGVTDVQDIRSRHTKMSSERIDAAIAELLLLDLVRVDPIPFNWGGVSLVYPRRQRVRP